MENNCLNLIHLFKKNDYDREGDYETLLNQKKLMNLLMKG